MIYYHIYHVFLLVGFLVVDLSDKKLLNIFKNGEKTKPKVNVNTGITFFP